MAETTAADFLPANTGQNLGSAGQRWNLYANNIFATSFGQTVFASSQAGADLAAQINAAVAALPATGGVVDCRDITDDQTCTSGTITLGSSSKPVLLLLGNFRIISNATPVISVPGPSWIMGQNSKGGAGFSAVNSIAAGGTVILWTGSNGGIRNLFLGASTGASRGLYVQASGTTSVQFNEFTNIQLNGPGGGTATCQGVRLEAATATALVSHNTFTNIWAHDFGSDFALVSSSTVGPTDNTFINLNPQSFGGAAGTGIAISSGSVNNFYGGIAEGLAVGIDIENTSSSSYNSFFGFRTETNTANIIDNGTGTMFVGHSLDVATISGTDSQRTYIGQGNVNTTQLLPATLKINGGIQVLDTASAPSAASFASGADAGTGFTPFSADHSIRFASNGAYTFEIVGASFRSASTAVIGFASAADPTANSNDTGISRGAANQVNVGNGTAGDASGRIVSGSAMVGASGTVLVKIAKYQATLSPATVAANTTVEQVFTVTGAAVGDNVIGVSKAAAQAGLGIVGWRLGGANSIAITFANVTASPITPTAGEGYAFLVVQ